MVERNRGGGLAHRVLRGVGPHPFVPGVHGIGVAEAGSGRHQNQCVGRSSGAGQRVGQPEVTAEAVADPHDGCTGRLGPDAVEHGIDVGEHRLSAVVALVGGNGGRTVPEQVDRHTSVRRRDEFDRRIPDGSVRVDTVDPDDDCVAVAGRRATDNRVEFVGHERTSWMEFRPHESGADAFPQTSGRPRGSRPTTSRQRRLRRPQERVRKGGCRRPCYGQSRHRRRASRLDG